MTEFQVNRLSSSRISSSTHLKMLKIGQQRVKPSLLYLFELKIITMLRLEASQGIATKAPKWSKHRPARHEKLPPSGVVRKRKRVLAIPGVMTSRIWHSLSLPTIQTTLRKSVRLDNA